MTETIVVPEIITVAIHAARLARGPSRRLDALAWVALHSDTIPVGDITVSDDGVVRVHRPNGRRWRHTTARERYSESVEMAAKALGERYGWRVRENGHVEIYEIDDGPVQGAKRWHDHGTTPALGLLIAALEMKRRWS